MTGAILVRTALFAGLWWILAESRLDTWWLGLAAVAAGVGASLALAPPGQSGFSIPGLVLFIGYFLLHSIRGGAQVAAIALRPRLDLRPDLVEIPISLPPGLPRVVLTATLGLMPGTASVSLDGERLLVHVLDRGQPVLQETRDLERQVARMFGLAP